MSGLRPGGALGPPGQINNPGLTERLWRALGIRGFPPAPTLANEVVPVVSIADLSTARGRERRVFAYSAEIATDVGNPGFNLALCNCQNVAPPAGKTGVTCRNVQFVFSGAFQGQTVALALNLGAMPTSGQPLAARGAGIDQDNPRVASRAYIRNGIAAAVFLPGGFTPSQVSQTVWSALGTEYVWMPVHRDLAVPDGYILMFSNLDPVDGAVNVSVFWEEEPYDNP